MGLFWPGVCRGAHMRAGGEAHRALSPQAFFTDRYLQEHPESLAQIEKLKDLIAWQVEYAVVALPACGDRSRLRSTGPLAHCLPAWRPPD